MHVTIFEFPFVEFIFSIAATYYNTASRHFTVRSGLFTRNFRAFLHDIILTLFLSLHDIFAIVLEENKNTTKESFF